MTFPSRSAYESLIYNLPDEYSQVVHSTLHMYSTSALTALVQGQVTLRNGLVIKVVEVLDFKNERIRHYSYTILQEDERIRWYDSQPHPDNPDLASTFPHHLHDHPHIKHNRKPAPGISFTAPNIPTLIEDCLALGEEKQG